jgi:nucleotide-binding universal stress UspA family protein
MFRNILVAVDDSPQGQRAVRAAIDLVGMGYGRLTMIAEARPAPGWASTPMAAAACAPLARELEQEAIRNLHDAAELVPPDVPLTTILSRRPICAALRDRACSHCHDLIVIGSPARRRVSIAVRDGLTRLLLSRCHVPVLILHAHSPSGHPLRRGSGQLHPVGDDLLHGAEIAL